MSNTFLKNGAILLATKEKESCLVKFYPPTRFTLNLVVELILFLI